MKYRDLIQFEPIETVVKLKDADTRSEAERLVKTYVMSDSMADSLIGVVLPQLQFERTVDNKGVFIVGNYGTGKSHLMSVISAIAEDAELLNLVKHDEFKKHAQSIAGKFEVLRFEIGASKMNLRDIILSNIEKDLKKRGIGYKFPPVDKVTDNKQYLIEMMGLFEEKYPGKGYLIVVDELLDYLQHKKELEIKFDLGFLREMGEVSKNTRIRFMAGVQETLFDNPSFSFVAKTILKVKDRYEQIIIKREDISYVVSQRLLQKNNEQKAWIREHLQNFSSMYKNMADRLEEYTNLFPIHPAYLETFEKVYIAEKREVLKTITMTIREILDEDVPHDEPGLVSYDAYWTFIKNNPSNRTDPDIKEVIDKSEILEGIIRNSFTRLPYKPMALRIIYALSVHRLTTGSINVPIGITVQNMKDDLCIYDSMLPEKEEDFLITTIETVMREISNTVSGQFIEYNRENEQYYLDLKKDIDYNARIRQKADVLDDDSLNEYYFDIINKATEWDAPEYVTGFKIYEYELLWEDKNVTRQGYRFLGTPNERSTAHPPRDFYVYFLPPYGANNYNSEDNEDEVYFEFIGDDEFKDVLKLYTAAHKMAEVSSSESKATYLNKAAGYQKSAINWIHKNISQCFNVRYRGESRSILNWLTGRRLGDRTLKEQIDMAASAGLSTWFNELYPDYPRFSLTITSNNINQMFKNGMEYIAGKETDTGMKVLDSFKLLDGDIIAPHKSVYGKYFIDVINNLPQGRVLNRGDIIERINEDTEYDRKFKLEPIWVALILSAMVYSGDIILTVGKKTYDATMLKELAAENTYDLINFKHCERPRDIPIAVLKKLFEMLGLPPGQIVNANTRDAAVAGMLIRIDEYIEKALKAIVFLNGDTTIWGRPSLEPYKVENYKGSIRSFKEFLDSIKRYNTQAKLKNFKYTGEDIEKHAAALKQLAEIDKIKELKTTIETDTSYISAAEVILNDKSWMDKVNALKTKLEMALKDINSIDENFIRIFNIELAELKDEYISLYMELHKKHRLDLKGDNAKKRIMRGNELNNLKRLTAIEGILPVIRLTKILEKISGLNTCYNLTEQDMKSKYICPHCKFNPSEGSKPVYGVIDSVENDIDRLYEEWTEIIINSIEDPMVKGNIPYLKPEQQEAINKLLNTGKLPDVIDGNFISGVNTLMQGLEKIEVSIEDMKKAVFGDGPAGIDDIRARFERFIGELTKGKDENKVRIIIK
ncbi:MAG: exonuclease SbcC [Firmicutes bacterium]|nr:exonuclease SbcC [Bacillota bacterium]